MPPRRTRLLLWLALLPCGCGGATAPAPPPPVTPPVTPPVPPLQFPGCNVLFVSFDALQAAHVGHLGCPRDTTPTLDAVARQGCTFTHAQAVASWTVPSSMSWFTGVYPSEHRMVNKFTTYTRAVHEQAVLRKVAPGLVTLADVFQANGYATAGFCGNAGVSGGFGFEEGFDVYVHDQGIFGGLDRSVPRALDWLREHRGQKFFLFLHGYDIHGQYDPAGGLDYRYVDPGYDRRYLGSPREQEVLREEGLERGRATLRDADVQFWRAVYDEKVSRADARFRTFLDELDRLGLADNTLLVVTSDHGTELYEHSRFDHGFTLYDELVHVPLVIRLPGQAVRGRIPDRVSTIDLMPTLLDLAGLEVPERARRQLRGCSLAPVLRGEAVARDLYAETDYREYTYKRSILTPDGWKLICTLEDKSRELYHLPTDPGETQELQSRHPDRADELERRLFAHFRAIGHDLTARRWLRGLNPVYDSQAR